MLSWLSTLFHTIFTNLDSNVDLFIFVILLITLLFFNSKRVFKNTKSNSIFGLIMICVSSIIIFDAISTVAELFKSYNASQICKVCITGQYCFIELLSLIWLYYAIIELEFEAKLSQAYYIIIALPIIVVIIISLSSSWTGLMFYIDNINNYSRGPMYYLHASIPAIYLITSACLAFIKYKKEILADKKDSYIHIFFYSIIPIIGAIIQVLAKGSNYFMLSIVISIDMLHLNSIKKDAILDPLTKLNNKIQFNAYLEKKILNINDYKLYLLYFDMNNFKCVNDNFGHLEGDKAIITVSNILKSTFFGTGAFCARCGGDEFGIIVELDDKQLHKYINDVHNNLKLASSKLPYTLSVSIGYAQFNVNDAITAETLIKLADQNMYENKEKMKLAQNLTEQPV